MAENLSLDGPVTTQWGVVVRAYCELMDDVMPHLPNNEQIVYHRLFRLSHVRQNAFVKCRYEDLAPQCGLSLSTVRRGGEGVQAEQKVKKGGRSDTPTADSLPVLSTPPHR